MHFFFQLLAPAVVQFVTMFPLCLQDNNMPSWHTCCNLLLPACLRCAAAANAAASAGPLSSFTCIQLHAIFCPGIRAAMLLCSCVCWVTTMHPVQGWEPQSPACCAGNKEQQGVPGAVLLPGTANADTLLGPAGPARAGRSGRYSSTAFPQVCWPTTARQPGVPSEQQQQAGAACCPGASATVAAGRCGTPCSTDGGAAE